MNEKYDWKSFERTWKNDCFINERTNFAKDLEKIIVYTERTIY